MEPKAWLITPRERIGHEYNLLDSRIPMVATCGHTNWPQDLFPASRAGEAQWWLPRVEGPRMCAACLKKGAQQ